MFITSVLWFKIEFLGLDLDNQRLGPWTFFNQLRFNVLIFCVALSSQSVARHHTDVAFLKDRDGHLCLSGVSYPVSGGQAGVGDGGVEHAHQQVLKQLAGGAHVEQPFLQGPQARHVGRRVHAQHVAEAAQELQHHQALGEGGARQEQAWHTAELRQRLANRQRGIERDRE